MRKEKMTIKEREYVKEKMTIKEENT